jgi:hypothetical protein
MKSNKTLCGISIAVALQLGVLASNAQTNIYLYTRYETNITLAAGTYNIAAYGAQGTQPQPFHHHRLWAGV